MTVVLARLRQADWGRLAERLVLAAILAVAALISYTHLRDVWRHTGGPWDRLGPLLPDGLFASSWLQMRRRRRDGQPVGWLAWLALATALVITLGGNISAAVIAGHTDVLSIVVAALPAVVLTLAWELTTGHGARRPASDRVNERQGARDGASDATYNPVPAGPDVELADDVADDLETWEGELAAAGEDLASPGGSPGETDDAKLARLLAEGAGRQRLVDELHITPYAARKILERRAHQGVRA